MDDSGAKVMRRPAEVEGRPWGIGDTFVIKKRNVGTSVPPSPIYRVVSVDEEANTMVVEWGPPAVVFYTPARDFSGATSDHQEAESGS